MYQRVKVLASAPAWACGAPEIEITGVIPDPYDATEIGTRNYELTNHLGNVLTVISDKLTFNYFSHTTSIMVKAL